MCNLSVGIRNEGIELGIEKGREEGIKLGEECGMIKAMISLVKDGILKIEDAASRTNLSVSEFKEQYEQYLSEESEV